MTVAQDQARTEDVGLAPAAAEPCADVGRARIGPGSFLWIATQLALLVLVVDRFALGGSSYSRVLTLTAAGFLLHAHLPSRWRLPFFLGLSLAGLGLVLGPVAAAWVVVIGLVLIALGHLPLAWAPRLIVLVVAVAGLAAMRGGLWQEPWPHEVLPVVGAMFMFRLIIYLCDLRHEQRPVRLSFRLVYFFMVPNVCFPLFPVVDFRTLRSTYYDVAAPKIYQRGIDWMLRGVIHLLLYRIVYHRLTLEGSAVESSFDLAWFLITNILLYLRISGLFHLIVGSLKLFGFNLPETNHRYFLAVSFSDYWRRINIYWKDFMLKVVYYPLFVPLRRRGQRLALAVSTTAVFAASWLLHSYQWFWLQGSWPWRTVDAAFWGTVGFLVLANSLRTGWPRPRRLVSWTARLPESVRRAARIAATFTVICVLWSLWTSDSIREWVELWTGGEYAGSKLWALGWIFGLWMLVALGAALFGRLTAAPVGAASSGFGGTGASEAAGGSAPWRRPAVTVATLAALLVVGLPQVGALAGGQVADWLADLGGDHLSRTDAAMVERGYYEELLEVRRLDTPLLERVAQRGAPAEVPADSRLFRATDGFLRLEIVPSTTGLYSARPFSSNRWSMRDRDYERAKPPRTTRLALLGGSHVMGHGVSDEEVFEVAVENRLGRDLSAGGRQRFEILNFAVESYTPLHQVYLLENKILQFEPDVVVYVAHTADAVWARRHLTKLVEERAELPYDFLDELVRRAGLSGPRERTEFYYRKRLEPLEEELVRWIYQRMAALCRQQGVRPVWVFLPKLEEYGRQSMRGRLRDYALEAGFDIVMLDGVFRVGVSRRSLQVGEADFHPNAEGHRLIAERLFEELVARPELVIRPHGDDRIGSE